MMDCRRWSQIVAFATLLGSAAASEETWSIVRIAAPLESDIATLTAAGLDIWEYQNGTAVARVTPQESAWLAQSGFVVRTAYESDAAFLSAAGYDAEAARGADEAGAFHSYAEVVADLNALAAQYPTLCTVTDIGNSVQGRDLLMLKISDNAAIDEGEPEMLFTGCHHAREWISVEVPLYMAHQLLSNYGTDPEITAIVDNAEIHIIPMVNPDGHQYSITNQRLWRKNRAVYPGGTGVDLNRNYSVGWGGAGTSGSVSSDLYRGPSPWSEAESAAMRDFFLSRDIKTSLCFHSYSQLVLFPPGCSMTPTADHADFTRIGEGIASAITAVNGKAYRAGASAIILYQACGSSMDYYYETRGTMAFAMELPPDTFDPGFVLPEAQIPSVNEETFEGMKVLMKEFAAAPTDMWQVR